MRLHAEAAKGIEVRLHRADWSHTLPTPSATTETFIDAHELLAVDVRARVSGQRRGSASRCTMIPHDRPVALSRGLGNALILAWSMWVVIAELVIWVL